MITLASKLKIVEITIPIPLTPPVTIALGIKKKASPKAKIKLPKIMRKRLNKVFFKFSFLKSIFISS